MPVLRKRSFIEYESPVQEGNVKIEVDTSLHKVEVLTPTRREAATLAPN
jgi:hypothetical protein